MPSREMTKCELWVDSVLDAAIDERAVREITTEMREKLAVKQNEGRVGWHNPNLCTDEFLIRELLEHAGRHDWVDVCNFAMMLRLRQRLKAEETKGNCG